MISSFFKRNQSIHYLTLIFSVLFICLFCLSCKNDASKVKQSEEPVFFLVCNSDGLYCFIDNTGKEVVPCQYEDLWNFYEGLAAVENTNGLWGFMDAHGNEFIEPQYENYVCQFLFHFNAHVRFLLFSYIPLGAVSCRETEISRFPLRQRSSSRKGLILCSSFKITL